MFFLANKHKHKTSAQQPSYVWKRILTSALVALLFLITSNTYANKIHANQIILNAISTMPNGGGYALSSHAAAQFRQAVHHTHSGLKINPNIAQPSYCSSATYLIFLLTIQQLANAGTIQLNPNDWRALSQLREADGHGIWGRWNANGPGVARLFHTTGVGRNFTDLSQAQPGDFLKIFWRDAVGKHEFGHLVIFLGTAEENGQRVIRFWSSNKPHGYTTKTVPLSKIAHLLFSRLEHPNRLAGIANLPKIDNYLASLLKKPSSFREACKLSGVVDQ